ncbi:MAG TPA: hypothetical protein VGL77_00380 [Armatimonadota bacterium]
MALRRFMAIGFVVNAGDRFMPTASLLQWRPDTKAKPDTAYDSFTQLAAQLNALAVAPAGDETTLPDRVVDEEAFQQALQRCHRSADRLGIILLVVGILLLGIAFKLVFTYPVFGLPVSVCLLLLTLIIFLRRKR